MTGLVSGPGAPGRRDGAGPRAVVVGLGNPDRGDDGVGPAVARAVAALGPPGVRVAEHEDPTALLDLWAARDVAVVVDAVRSGRPPGSLVRLETGSAGRPLPASVWAGTGRGGTHALGLAAAVGLGRALDRMPRRVVLLGVEGDSYEHGSGLSPRVDAALPCAVDAVLDVLSEEAAADVPR